MVRNTDLVWGWTAKGLHWIAALFVLLLLAHGWSDPALTSRTFGSRTTEHEASRLTAAEISCFERRSAP